MLLPKYLTDIQSYVESIPYGDVSLNITRVNHNTVKITTYGKETMRYFNSQEAVDDLWKIIKNLIDTKYSGKAVIELEYKNGQISILGIHDTKEITY